MKKYLQVIVCVVFILSLAVNIAVSEAEEQIKSVKFSEDRKSDFRSMAITEGEIADINNAEMFSDPQDQSVIRGKKFIKRYLTFYWAYAEFPIQEICEKLNDPENYRNAQNTYIFFDHEVLQLYYRKQNTEAPCKLYLEKIEEPLPLFLKDIVNTNSTESFFDKKCKINDIICFGFNAHNPFGKAVYFITDQGNFVKYYNDWVSDEVMLYTEEEFRLYARDYYAYLSDPKNNYSADGKVLMRSALSFKEFLEKKQQGTLASPQVSSRSKTVKICLGAAGGIILLAGVIIGIVVIRRKKRNA